jgi:hypothetical protein
LSAAWANLSVGAALFRKLLQVDAFFPFFLILSLLLFLSFLSLFFSLSKAFSWDQSNFIGSGEVEKKLVFEVNRLKVELAIKQVDLEIEHQGRQNSEEVLRTQVAELEKWKEDALAALKEASEKSDGLKRDFEGIRVLLYFLSLFVCWFSDFCSRYHQLFRGATRNSRMIRGHEGNSPVQVQSG